MLNKLSKILKGEIRYDKVTRVLYSTDASIFEILPIAVCYPRDSEDIINIVKFAKAEKIPLHPRGAGSGMAGQALGNGIVLDFTRHMNAVLNFNKENSTITLQPGITQGKINEFLKSQNKIFPPDPSSGDYCTIGGMVSNNSSGSHSLKYGSTKEYVRKIKFVGEKGVEIDTDSVSPSRSDLVRIFNKYIDKIESEKPLTVKNSSGYNVFDSFKNNKIDFAKLLTGSEGTLGIFTEITLDVISAPLNVATAILLFSSTEKAIESVEAILKTKPSVLELVDDKLLKLLTDEDLSIKKIISTDEKAFLLIEYVESTPDEIKEKLNNLKNCISNCKIIIALDPKKCEQLWKIRKSAAPILNRVDGTTRAVRLIEDLCVPVDRLMEFYLLQKKIFDKYRIDCSFYGHIGSGNIHLDPHVDTDRKDLFKLFQDVARQSYELVVSLKGSISGEHGDGILRAPYVPLQYPKLYPLFCEIKKYFDPENIFNPGKKISDTLEWQKDTIRYSSNRVSNIYSLENEFREVEKCNGCGNCRIFCPLFKAVNSEEATSRAKSNLLRALIYGKINFEDVDDIKRVFDLCLNCKRCTIECQARIDIPTLVIKTRGAINSIKSPGYLDKLFQNPAFLGKINSLAPKISNYFINNKFVRNFLHLLNILSKDKKIPEFSRLDIKNLDVILDSRFRGNDGSETVISKEENKKLIYFIACSEKYNNPESAPRAIFLLKLLGYEVVSPDLSCCMLPAATYGDFKGIGRYAKNNFVIMSDYFKKGFKITTAETSCGLMLGYEYKLLGFDNIDLSKNYQNYYKLINDNLSYLIKLFKPIEKKIIIHYPCHIKAQNINTELDEILSKIPGLKIIDSLKLCCGMGGTYGFKKKNYDVARRAGGDLFAKIKEKSPDYVITACSICSLQIEENTQIKTLNAVDIIHSAIT